MRFTIFRGLLLSLIGCHPTAKQTSTPNTIQENIDTVVSDSSFISKRLTININREELRQLNIPIRIVYGKLNEIFKDTTERHSIAGILSTH
jgi:hypothetical protein